MNYRRVIVNALKEDVGRGDITTELLIPKEKITEAVILAKEECVSCGLDIAKRVFKEVDEQIVFKGLVREGEFAKKNQVLARISGKTRSILTAERTALNFLSLLSGIATKTRQFVEAVKPYKAKIMDTRKTIPGLRELQKYAVRVGGGYNHRMRLDEMILIKDNHIRILNPKSETLNPKQIQNPKSKIQKSIKFEIEVKNLREFKEVLKLKPDIIMLDNMSVRDISRAVLIKRRTKDEGRRTRLEASGGVTLESVRKIAATGVDMISVGELTHSVNSINMSLEIV